MGSYESHAFVIESFSARSSFGSFGIGAFFHNKVKTYSFIHQSSLLWVYSYVLIEIFRAILVCPLL